MKTIDREKYLDRMIAIYGYENEIVIHFATMLEKLADNEWNDTCVRLMVEAHEFAPYIKEE